MKRKKVRFIELTDKFITRKTIFCFCSQKVVLRGRTTAPLKICLRGQLFVCVETSRSHLAWSTDDRNLTEFLVIKTNLSKFCLKCDPSLSVTHQERQPRIRPAICTALLDLDTFRQRNFIAGYELEDEGHSFRVSP